MGSTAVISIETDDLLSPTANRPSAILTAMSRATESNESRLAELLLAVANKDRLAFAAFYDATAERALSLVLRITQKMEIAEEVMGDVYLQVWRQADRFDPARGNALAWLTTLCRSRALDTIRKNSSSPTHAAVPISEVPEPEASDIPQDLLLAVEQESAIHAALQALQASERQLLALAYFRGYSHSELAEFTGMPLGTVKTKLRRSLKKLKERMSASHNPERTPA